VTSLDFDVIMKFRAPSFKRKYLKVKNDFRGVKIWEK